MYGAHTLLQDLALVLGVAAVTAVVFRRLRQPVVIGYVLAGLLIGPHLPGPLYVDAERVRTLSELGVVLVMFSVGLELSVRKLVRLAPTAGIVGVIQISTMMWLGYLAGQALGWTLRESVFAGAMVAVSSTMIVAKAFAEQRIGGRLADVVFGVLVMQDLAAVLLLAVLTAVSSGGGLAGPLLASTAARLVAFLAVIVAVGFAIVPRAVRAIARLDSPETLLLASIGLSFALALLALRVGYSVALGAFIAGSLVAESGHSAQIERLVRPVRDVLAAVFFVAVGMMVDPRVVLQHWTAVLLLVAVVVVGQIASVSLGAFLTGNGVRTSLQAGMSLAQIGEFSFIIAALGVATGAIGPFLFPVAVAVSVLTAFATPWLVRASARVATFVDRRLPAPLQTFVSLYGAWLEELRARRTGERSYKRVGRLVGLLGLDAAVLAAIVIAADRGMRELLPRLQDRFGIAPAAGRWIVVGAAALLAVPFLAGILRLARSLGARLAAAALPPAARGRVDLAAAPRRVLVVALQLAVVLLVGVPLLAVTQPFLPAVYGLLLLALLLGLAGVGFWRSATNLEEHVRAGAQVIVESLARLGAAPGPEALAEVQPPLPGLGPITPVRLEPGSHAVGRTIAQLELRALTGATVIAIGRGTAGLVRPTGAEELHAGDVLALAGTHEAIAAATELLHLSPRLAPGEPPPPAEEPAAAERAAETRPVTGEGDVAPT